MFDANLNVSFNVIQDKKALIDEKQCAWEAIVEMRHRSAVYGKLHDEYCTNINGEILEESLQSVSECLKSLRTTLKKYPIWAIPTPGVFSKIIFWICKRLRRIQISERYLNHVIDDVISKLLRTFLDRWQKEYRDWVQANPGTPFPDESKMLDDWHKMKICIRKVCKEIDTMYNFGLYR